MANVIKRMWHISVRNGRGVQIGENGPGALEPRIGKCHKQNVACFSKEWEGAQIGENGPGDPEAQNQQMS